MTDSDEFWLFGYGSLIWKPPPHFDRRLPGWVTGYVRRFWQRSQINYSQDHRGTPDAPGRVVTLIERAHWATLVDHHGRAPDRVWGVAYRIAAGRVAEVKEYLDIREINGYSIHYTPFQPAAGPDATGAAAAPIRTIVYIGTPDNDQFTGPQDIQALAEHIHASTGPSGRNRDYLWELERALDELSAESGDEHVSDLAARVRAVEEQQQQQQQQQQSSNRTGTTDNTIMRSPPPVIISGHDQTRHEFQKASSVDEQEETEKSC